MHTAIERMARLGPGWAQSILHPRDRQPAPEAPKALTPAEQIVRDENVYDRFRDIAAAQIPVAPDALNTVDGHAIVKMSRVEYESGTGGVMMEALYDWRKQDENAFVPRRVSVVVMDSGTRLIGYSSGDALVTIDNKTGGDSKKAWEEYKAEIGKQDATDTITFEDILGYAFERAKMDPQSPEST